MSVLPEVSFEKGESVTVYLKLGDGGVFSVIGGPAGRVTTHSLFGSAYLGFGDPSGNAQGYKYDGLKWGTDTVSYYINQNGTPDATNEFAAVTAAFQTWENDAGSVIDFNYLGTTGLGINLWDGVNVVAWVAHLPCSPTPCDEGLAATTRRVDPISGNIAEIDLSINDFYVWSDSGEAGKYDIQDAVTHEAGHWLQLAHVTQPGDSEATMWPDVAAGETKKRTLEWGDIAGLRFIYPMTVSATGWFGDSTQGADIALRDVNKNGILDVIMIWVDNPSGPNSIYYRIGWDIDNNGAVSSWTGQKVVAPGGWVGDLTAEAGIAMSDINSNGVLDVIAFWIDAPSGGDTMYYRVGWDINTAGDVASWTTQVTVGGGNIGDSTSGGGTTLVNLDSNTRPELIVTWIDNPSGGNTIYYRIGWNLDTSGNTAIWSSNKVASTSIGDESDGAGVAPAVWFTDEFSETIGRQWTTQQGTWALESGELSGSGTSAEIRSTKTFPSDRTFQVRMKTVTAGSNSWYTAWVVGKYVDDCSRSTLILHTTGTLEFNVAVGCTKSTWTASTGLSIYDWHTTKMVYTGNNAKVYVDNVLYFDVTDSKFSQRGDSKVQLASWGPSHSHFDDAMVDDSTGKPDLVFAWVDDPSGDNRMYYRVGWDLNSNGDAGSWSPTKWTPAIGGFAGGIGFQTQGGGLATGDINGNGFLEMIFAYIDDPSGANTGRFRVEWESRVNSHPNY